MDGLNWLSCPNLVPRAFPQDRVKALGKRLLGLPKAGACAHGLCILNAVVIFDNLKLLLVFSGVCGDGCSAYCGD